MAKLLFIFSKNNTFQQWKIKSTAFNTSVSKDLNLVIEKSHWALFYDHLTPVRPIKIQTPEATAFILGNFSFQKNTFNEMKEGKYCRTVFYNELPDIKTVFNQLNGIYCYIGFNEINNKVSIYTDYLGFFPLYLYQDERQIIVSSEIKLIKEVADGNLSWSPQAIQSYLDNGHLISNQSWFTEIVRMRPASMYSLNLKTSQLNRTYYWTWSEVSKTNRPIEELLDSYYELFKSGISQLDQEDCNSFGVSLSGGLDSRLIAYIASKTCNLNSFSFGNAVNYEIQIAQKVAKALSIKHEFIQIGMSNWLENRLSAFWKVDGLLHLGHLHEAPVHKYISASYPVYFHGFFGGGIYANRSDANLAMNPSLLPKYLKLGTNPDESEDVFYSKQCIDPYLIDQKIRNQSAHSIYLLSSHCKLILPFYNMNWMILNYSIDDCLQLNHGFYLKFLNKYLPKQLLEIPWQRTGIPPHFIFLNLVAGSSKLPAIREKVAQFFGTSKHFINYNEIDRELNQWLLHFKSEIRELGIGRYPNTREIKFRLLSLVLIIKMMNKNTQHVL